MGCFDIKCNVTDTTISYGDDIVQVFFVEADSKYNKNEPLCPAIFGTYNDYGSVDPYVDSHQNAFVFSYLDSIYHAELKLFGDYIRNHYGDLHQGFAFVENMVRERACLVPIGWQQFLFGGEAGLAEKLKSYYDFTTNQYHPALTEAAHNQQRVKKMVMHRYVYDLLIKQGVRQWDGEDDIPSKTNLISEIINHYSLYKDNQIPPLMAYYDSKESMSCFAKIIGGISNEIGDCNGRSFHITYRTFVEKLLVNNPALVNVVADIFDMHHDHLFWLYGLRLQNVELRGTDMFMFEQHAGDLTRNAKIEMLEETLKHLTSKRTEE